MSMADIGTFSAFINICDRHIYNVHFVEGSLLSSNYIVPKNTLNMFC